MGSSEDVHLTSFDTELGRMHLASTVAGVVCCTLPGGDEQPLRDWLDRHLPGSTIEVGLGRNLRAVKAVRDYLAGKRATLDGVELDVRGTTFQRKVWTVLREVPYGEVVSYAELARRAGKPGAARACGAANGANPLPLFQPCHRVVAADGTLGGFGGGLPLKRKLLDLEGSLAAAGD